jgi:thiamine-phosphate pyrophosphorylase
MIETAYDGAKRLARLASRLDGPRGALPAFFAFTDPARTPDPLRLAACLAPGCGLVLRTYGKARLTALAPALAALCRERGIGLWISADPALARRCGADGVHWPENMLNASCVRRCAGLSITTSAHGPGGLRRAQALADAVFISPVFASASPSAGRAIGPLRAAAIARRCDIPVYALGGVNARRIRRLEGLGLSGAAAIGALSTR